MMQDYMEKRIISHPLININNMKYKFKGNNKIKHLETKIHKVEGNRYISNNLSSFSVVFLF